MWTLPRGWRGHQANQEVRYAWAEFITTIPAQARDRAGRAGFTGAMGIYRKESVPKRCAVFEEQSTSKPRITAAGVSATIIPCACWSLAEPALSGLTWCGGCSHRVIRWRSSGGDLASPIYPKG